jgi:Carboxypeptidase regulatory-like domain
MMRGMKLITTFAAIVCAWAVAGGAASAQSVTTGSITGVVTDGQKPVAGASVIAIHEPSGTSYEAATDKDGRYTIPNMRVGGPYTVMVTYVGTGTAFAPHTTEGLAVNLGSATDVNVTVKTINLTEKVVVVGQTDPVFSSERTGAATTITRNDLATLPNITGRLENVTRLTPQNGGGMSFAGQDSRENNITVDGSYFNNSFGLGNTPGDRTGVAPISLHALEQVQVNVAPYDVRQGNFVGAAVNSVTRSGSNDFRGSFYYQFRGDDMVGTEAHGLAVNPGSFTFRETGEWLAGPVVKSKLFFFENYEQEKTEQPGTTFRANAGGETVGGNVTRVLASDLDTLGGFLKSRLNFDPGTYQNYQFGVPAKRFIGRGDYNLNNANKITFRYVFLNSSTDVLQSNSASLGNGNRRSSTLAMNFSGSNYSILENIRSGVGQWNSVIGRNKANELIAGYTTHDESRGQISNLFPVVDILDGTGTTYTSFGSEPFTPNNELYYHSFQAQDNFSWFRGAHTLTAGGSFEKYHSDNVFFPGKQSVYVYNTLQDFYTDANDFLANPNRTVSPVTLRLFQVRYMNLPGLEKPIQPLDVAYTGAYAQDEWSARGNLKLTAGLRVDVPSFGQTGYANADADARTFLDENGQRVGYSTAKLPDAKFLWSPRFGFNWDVKGDQRTQVRGGTGVFTGPPPYVWISNQIGNTGVLTGFDTISNTTSRPFNPNPDTYKPKGQPTGAPAATYELALTDPGYRFPQVWRTNFALDRKLPWGFSSTTEYIYNRDVNGTYYINANQPVPQSAYTGADTRPRWIAPAGSVATRLPANQNVIDAVVLKNQSSGRSWNFAESVQKTFTNGMFVKAAYSYGEARNIVDAGSIAFGSWQGNPVPGNLNTPPMAFSGASPGHRFFLTGAYSHEYLKFGQTTISIFYDQHTQGNTSYVFSGDANGDTGTSNDLLYIPRNQSEMNFQPFSTGGVGFTPAQQAAAWDAYINQDPYLSKHRGEYAERGAVFFPMVRRMDLSLQQNFFRDIGGARHAFALRIDMLNFGNLLNHDWGVGYRIVSNSPLTNPAPDANGALGYRMRVLNGALMDHTFEHTGGLPDVYTFMVTLKYNFR